MSLLKKLVNTLQEEAEQDTEQNLIQTILFASLRTLITGEKDSCGRPEQAADPGMGRLFRGRQHRWGGGLKGWEFSDFELYRTLTLYKP